MRVATMVPSASRRPLTRMGSPIRAASCCARQAAAEDGRCADAHAPALDLEQLPPLSTAVSGPTAASTMSIACARAWVPLPSARTATTWPTPSAAAEAGLAVQRDRRGGVEVHLDAVHADAGEAGDDAEHAELRVGALAVPPMPPGSMPVPPMPPGSTHAHPGAPAKAAASPQAHAARRLFIRPSSPPGRPARCRSRCRK